MPVAFIRFSDVIVKFEVTETELRRLIAQGALGGTRVGDTYEFKLSDVESLLERRPIPAYGTEGWDGVDDDKVLSSHNGDWDDVINEEDRHDI